MDKFTSFSLINLIAHADIIVQSVMLLLVAASLWSWAIVFDKLIKFRILKTRSDRFEELFESGEVLEEIYNIAKEEDNHPLARVFVNCITEWKSNSIKQIIASGADKKSSLKERLINSMQVAVSQSMHKMESGLNFLAIVGSSAPFIGLFGTVWGIMTSFQGIAASKNTSLAVVAPGIAEALLATAIGLFAAIPAVFFYNIFSAKINHFAERANNFSIQLLNLLSKELDR
ncbi:MAG: protein TolQ [Alphaproteobacteria bacterium]|nr:protein TolQ [Alphaproteobacteria bacterium]